VIAAGVIVSVTVTVMIGLGATQWIDKPFPGFFLLPNRVIASIARMEWPVSREGAIYQMSVVAVDGEPVSDSSDVYRRVTSETPGTRFTYALRHGAATNFVTLESQRFSVEDYLLIFGSYLATGLLYLLLGLLGLCSADKQLGRAILCLGGTAGVYSLSAVALYDPGASIRLHALAEALFPAAIVQLAFALVRGRAALAGPVTATAWAVSFGLAIAYQFVVDQPGAYSVAHAACETYLGVAGIGLIAMWLTEYWEKRPVVRSLASAAVVGAVLGLGVPAIVMVLSGLSGGSLPVNVCAATAFLFPLCLGYGLILELMSAELEKRNAASRLPHGVAP
jgi:hypothetical protein